MPVGLKRCKVIQPFFIHATVITFVLLFLCRNANNSLEREIADNTKCPWLFICAGWSCGSTFNNVFNYFFSNRSVAKISYASSLIDPFKKFSTALQHLPF